MSQDLWRSAPPMWVRLLFSSLAILIRTQILDKNYIGWCTLSQDLVMRKMPKFCFFFFEWRCIKHLLFPLSLVFSSLAPPALSCRDKAFLLFHDWPPSQILPEGLPGLASVTAATQMDSAGLAWSRQWRKEVTRWGCSGAFSQGSHGSVVTLLLPVPTHSTIHTHTHTHTHTHRVLVCLGCHKKVQTRLGGLTQHTFIYSQLWRSEYKISLWAGVAFPKVIVPGWQMAVFLLCLFALSSLCVSVS